jgi:hypothetical protein
LRERPAAPTDLPAAIASYMHSMASRIFCAANVRLSLSTITMKIAWCSRPWPTACSSRVDSLSNLFEFLTRSNASCEDTRFKSASGNRTGDSGSRPVLSITGRFFPVLSFAIFDPGRRAPEGPLHSKYGLARAPKTDKILRRQAEVCACETQALMHTFHRQPYLGCCRCIPCAMAVPAQATIATVATPAIRICCETHWGGSPCEARRDSAAESRFLDEKI